MVWLCSTKKALRGYRLSKKLSSTFATTFWFTFSSYTPKALSTSSLCFVAFLPPFPLKGDYQGVNFFTRLLVRRVEVQMVFHFLHWVQNISFHLFFFGMEGVFFTIETTLKPTPSLSFSLLLQGGFSIASYTICLKLFSSPRDTFCPIMSFLMAESF
jgi:hypothetical protein